MRLSRRRCFGLSIGLLGLLFATGCGETTAVEPDRSDSPEEDAATRVDVATFTYTRPELKPLFERFDAAARQRGRDWRSTPYVNTHAKYDGFWYSARWVRREPEWNRWRAPLGDTEYVSVGATPGGRKAEPLLIRQVVVSAVKMPDDGWGARCDFATEGPPESDRIDLTFYYAHFDGEVRREFQLPGAGISGTRGFDGWRYRYGARVAQPRGEKIVRALLASPESFRDASLAEQDRLEEEVRAQFADGELIGDLITPSGWSSRDGAPPDPPPDLAPLSDTRRRVILAAALSRIAERRKLIRKSYREMHAAAVATYPLLVCLDDVDRATAADSVAR